GYGRSGDFFAHQHSGIKADIITVAKGIANGFPMGGVLISPQFEAKHGMLGTTFGGNHLACAAAIAVLDVIENENLVENAREVGEYLVSELKKIPQLKEVRGRGLMIGIEIDGSAAELRKRLLFERHIFTGGAGATTIRLLPALTITSREVDIFISNFKELL
ncbi:MAG: aminotransferase class III-fold pyridoxal phosphate-dependent enzyme, partial [Alistipes sp.]|nr:aminotransferase class III-fold pyridoxal phosphate-dependent enzyme [Alistipes sp.]